MAIAFSYSLSDSPHEFRASLTGRPKSAPYGRVHDVHSIPRASGFGQRREVGRKCGRPSATGTPLRSAAGFAALQGSDDPADET